MLRKHHFLLGAFIAISSLNPITAQRTSSGSSEWTNNRGMTYQGQIYNALDTAYIPATRMKQHREFLDHQYVFPAKPRNMVELGVGAGLYNILGDVPGLMAWQKGGYGFHAHIRKAWGYVISTRLQYNYGIAKGMQWQESRNYKYNPAWNQNYYGAGNAADRASDAIHYNYRMESHQLNADMIVAANNIRFHKARSVLSVYSFVGIGALAYKTYVNSLNGGNPYDYCTILGDEPQIYENKGTIVRNLQKGMDDSYEHAAESEAGRSRASFGKAGLGGVAKTFQFLPSVGGGFQIRLGKHVNFSLEDRLSIPIDDDLLDGQRWAEQVYGSAVLTQRKDVINYLGAGLNFNIGSGKKNVEPLYWINPLVYAYSQTTYGDRVPWPDMELPDEDHDGITDLLDKCPGTPAGVAVDSHGCPLDTDHDLVPDYLDKQLITPTECQPSDADGIGKCPCQDCGPIIPSGECALIKPGVVTFSKKGVDLDYSCREKLRKLGDQMKASPTCYIVIRGYPKPPPHEHNDIYMLGQKRLQAVLEHLKYVEGIDGDRIKVILDRDAPIQKHQVEYYPELH